MHMRDLANSSPLGLFHPTQTTGNRPCRYFFLQILLRQSDPLVNNMCVNRLISAQIYARLCVNGNTDSDLWGCSSSNSLDYKVEHLLESSDICLLNDIYLFGVLRRFQHCTGHITMGSWKGRGNQYIQFVRVLYCKLPTNGKQLPAFPLEAMLGIEPRPQRWET